MKQIDLNYLINTILSDRTGALAVCINNKDKELFIKYYIEGYELEEIAKTNKTNVTNLYSRLSRGRKKIKKNDWVYL